MRCTAETRGVLEMRNFTPAYMKGVDVPAYYYVGTILSELKFLGCTSKQIFLLGSPLCALELR